VPGVAGIAHGVFAVAGSGAIGAVM
jgi:hypothetical protein